MAEINDDLFETCLSWIDSFNFLRRY